MANIQQIDVESPDYSRAWASLLISEVSLNITWLDNLRANGVAAVYSDDGCADWTTMVLTPVLAQYNDGLHLGALVVVGCYDNFTLVRLNVKHKNAAGRVSWSMERVQ